MAFSLVSTRVLLRHGSTSIFLAAPFAGRATAQLSTRHFSITRAVMDPARKTTDGSSTTKKTTKAKTDDEAPAKRTRAKKDTSKKTATKIKAEDMPPKRAPMPYTIFFTKYVAGINSSSSEDQKITVASAAKEAAKIWNNFSEHEKQAFRDEAAELKTAYEKKRDEYFSGVDPSVLRAINKQRAAKGLPRIRSPFKQQAPHASPFFLFIADERKNEPIETGMDAFRQMSALAKSAGIKWRSMSDVEKQPYIDRANELNAQRASGK